MGRGKIRRALVAAVLAAGLSGSVVAVEASPAAAASCTNDYTDTTGYNYADWWTGESVWKDTRWHPSNTSGCRDVNVSKVYDRWSGRYGCAVMRVWWRDENSPRNWVWACQGLTVLSRKKIGSSFQVETLNRPYAANVLR